MAAPRRIRGPRRARSLPHHPLRRRPGPGETPLSLELHLRIAGTLLILLATAHLFFPKLLGWKKDLAKLTLLNRQIFLVHVTFIVLILLLFGTLALAFAPDLVAPSRLAKALLGGLTLFWGMRLITQQFIYDRSLWRGNRRNTVLHILASLLWCYLTTVFGWGWWRQVAGEAPF